MSGGKVQINADFDGFQKRSGLVVPFRWQKIELAIDRAVEEIARKHSLAKNEGLASKVTDQVMQQLNTPQSEFYVFSDENSKRTPKIEDVQDLVEIVLAEQGETLVVAAYKRYRKQREMARRNIRVRGSSNNGALDISDANLLLVESTSKNINLPWDRKRIVKQILDKTDLSVELAINVAKSVENRIIGGDLNVISTTLIRELVNNELTERGYSQQLRDLSLYRISKDYLENLLFPKPGNSANLATNNPEAVNQGIAALVLKQWALDTIYSPEVKRAHDTGAIHVHDLGSPTRAHRSSHSIEYVKKYGLSGLNNLNASSSPARSASVLTGQLNTFLASMQLNYTSQLSIGYVNVFYAPLLKGMDDSALKQAAQDLIFSTSQNTFSHGGKTLDFELNIHTGVPAYLKTIPAIGPGGRYQLRLSTGDVVELTEELRDETDADGYNLMDLYYTDPEVGKRLVLRELTDRNEGTIYDPEVEGMLGKNGESIVIYADYTKEVHNFSLALLQVFSEGDAQRCAFKLPTCVIHVSDETFEDSTQFFLFQKACERAGENGSTHFKFNRNETSFSSCHSQRTSRSVKHPESSRSCGLQNVQINTPQASYRAARTGGDIVKNFLSELDLTMELAVDAHLQKKAKSTEMISSAGHPLWQLGKMANDGKPYVDLDTSTYILSLVGVTEAIGFLIGQELHESKEAQRLGLKVVAHMHAKAKKLSAKHNLNFSLEESPSEGAAHRMAKSDIIYFAEESKDTIKESDDKTYYTNSTHISAKAEISLFDRVVEQSKYHSMIESKAVTRCTIGEGRTSPDFVACLTTEAFYQTQSAQICICSDVNAGGNIVIDRFDNEKIQITSKRYNEWIAHHAEKTTLSEETETEIHLVSVD
ncbi:MAG: anaerobic ribonucleoside-triphosphate reductase [Pontiella sp.]